ncbi:hypothetical protein BD626DRAFT_515372, partial [Schizophyllum amplum]
MTVSTSTTHAHEPGRYRRKHRIHAEQGTSCNARPFPRCQLAIHAPSRSTDPLYIFPSIRECCHHRLPRRD